MCVNEDQRVEESTWRPKGANWLYAGASSIVHPSFSHFWGSTKVTSAHALHMSNTWGLPKLQHPDSALNNMIMFCFKHTSSKMKTIACKPLELERYRYEKVLLFPCFTLLICGTYLATAQPLVKLKRAIGPVTLWHCYSVRRTPLPCALPSVCVHVWGTISRIFHPTCFCGLACLHMVSCIIQGWRLQSERPS